MLINHINILMKRKTQNIKSDKPISIKWKSDETAISHLSPRHRRYISFPDNSNLLKEALRHGI